MEKKMLPIGVSNFEKLISQEYYYVDKTDFIFDLLKNKSEVTLFTRPRRFGKTLNMNMLNEFFNVEKDSKELFKGLAIEKNISICEKYQNKRPVIFISMKEVEGRKFEDAYDNLKELLSELFIEFDFLLNSEKMNFKDLEVFKKIITCEASLAEIKASLHLLTKLLYKYYNQKIIILMDEYDVPLQKASINGYYDEMLDVIRAMMSKSLKDNLYLELGVITGCLRVSKESIFTGFNNLRVYTISNPNFSQYFGFTEEEVYTMLKYYDLGKNMEKVKNWYDGYLFGDTEVYCPFSVLNYLGDIKDGHIIEPQNYWVNSSGNDIIKSFIIKADENTLEEFKGLIQGKTVTKPITETLTYSEIYKNIDNLWSMLYISGYLTKVRHIEENIFELRIPNEEVKEVFVSKVNEWFKDGMFEESRDTLKEICIALKEGNTKFVESMFSEILQKTITLRDIQTLTKKEVVYHMIFTGILNRNTEWRIKSNADAGDGYADIIVKDFKAGKAFVIEFKNASSEKELDKEIENAFNQIEKKNYVEAIQEEVINEIYLYAISCFNKKCKVEMKRIQK